jgi:hypothetical protein
MEITINDKKYKVQEAKTDSEREKGLQGVKSLPKNEGMLFYFDPPKEECSFWMKDTLIPLDIVFIDEDGEVISVKQGTPNSEDMITEHNVAYVLEVNQNSGIKKGDELDLDPNDKSGPVMKVIGSDGSTQMELYGGERIFSRKNTRILIKKAKKADETKLDKDYKALGKYIFKCIKTQDNR